MKKENDSNKEITPDLKHDTMEYSASSEGDDILDMDNADMEDDSISADELEILEGGGIADQNAALKSVEKDRKKDNDIIFDAKDEEVGYEENLNDENLSL